MEQIENTEGIAIPGDERATPPDAGAGELVCPYCGAGIPADEKFCPECGFERGSLRSEGATEGSVEVPAEPGVVELVVGEERFVLAIGKHILGRTEGDIVVSNPYLSRRHLELRVSADQLFAIDLGSTNGTFLDGTRLDANEEVEVPLGAELKAGELELKLKRLAPAAARVTSPAGSVEEPADAEAAMKEEEIVKAEVDTGEVRETELAEVASNWHLVRGDETFPLPFGEIRIGRKSGRNDIAFPDDGYISGQHLLLEADLNYVQIKDLNSTNGTFVGGHKIEPDTWIEVTPGVEIRIGQTRLVVDRAAPPVEAVQEGEELPAPDTGAESEPAEEAEPQSEAGTDENGGSSGE